MITKNMIIASKKSVVGLLLLLILPLVSQGQVELKGSRLINAVHSSPQEKAFVHYNSSFLLAGEYLFYKFYLLNSQSAEQNPLSKIGYLELQGEDGVSIFRHKLKLDSGTGKGDFFIPTTVPSGNYRLVGYTRWMLNGDKTNVFEGDLVIVNPYLNEQQNLQTNSEERLAEVLESQSSLVHSSGIDESISGGEQREYGRRELVALGIEEFSGLEPGGAYSVSVRKKSGIEVPKMLNSEVIFNSGTGSSAMNSTTEIHLPELRGELITGQIVPRQGQEIASIGGRSVALSIQGEDFVLKISRTDGEGNFFFLVDNFNNADDAFLQVLGKDRNLFDIKIDPPSKAAATSFPNFQLSPEMKEILEEESIYNQIENGYFSVKPDTIKKLTNSLPFYGDLMLTYNLNDYTRFETLKEVLVEIVRDISVKRDKEGEYLKTRGENALVDTEMSSLLIVDDIVVQDHELLINYPAKMIHSIGVLRQKYFYGPEVFHGIIHVRTVDGNFLERLTADYLYTKELLRPQPEKKYFKQTYAKAEDKTRIPDFRRQLLWDPDLKPDNEIVEFYTSDVAGTYEIVLQGFSTTGEPISITKQIRVR